MSTAPASPELGADRQRGIRPIVLLAQAVLAVAVVVALVAVLTRHPSTTGTPTTGSGHGAHVWEYTVPLGTAAAIDAGQKIFVFPARLDVRVGDELIVHNNDNRNQEIGPYEVDRGATLEQRFTEPGTITGICTIHPSGRVEIVIR